MSSSIRMPATTPRGQTKEIRRKRAQETARATQVIQNVASTTLGSDSAGSFSTPIFDRWIGEREVPFLGTNSGASPLAFQTWHHFKEAFPPELIKQMIVEDQGEVGSCLDVFGGSGTTALASQFLGIASTTIEVNPFLVDVIRAKVATYDADQLAQEFGLILRRASEVAVESGKFFENMPPTFVEPGVTDRWIFDATVADQLARLVTAIETIENEIHRRFFRVLVGGILTDVSNVVINGKGRRYRRNWKDRRRGESSVLTLFSSRVRSAIADVHRFGERPAVIANVLLGDARKVSAKRMHDLAILSPPYPNSFDYTDIYNLELWVLGYLNDSAENRGLRGSTLSSHVQLHRKFSEPPSGSKTLLKTVQQLNEIRETLWSPWIPAMVGGYFADMVKVLDRIKGSLREGGRSCIVVGNSRYGGVLIPTAKILGELSRGSGWKVHSNQPVRAMRSSAQQGGSTDLDETLLILVKQLS